MSDCGLAFVDEVKKQVTTRTIHMLFIFSIVLVTASLFAYEQIKQEQLSAKRSELTAKLRTQELALANAKIEYLERTCLPEDLSTD